MTVRATYHAKSTTRFVASVVFLCVTLMAGVVTGAATDRGALPMSVALVAAEASPTATDAAHPTMGAAEHAGSHAEGAGPCDRPCGPERCPPDCCAVACASPGVGVAASALGVAAHVAAVRSTHRRDVAPLVATAPSPPYRPPIA